MIAIFKKEINSFFSSATGYLVIGLFLLVSGLFLWVFKGEFNILDNGFADLSPFFSLAPWIFLFLVPAVSMRSFAEEKRQGTFEMLLTKPISKFQIVAGKYLAVLTLAILALIPSLIYVLAVHTLGNPTGNIDLGSTAGSYLGLIFLLASYAAVGVFASSLTSNQIVSFILAVFLCFTLYIGFESVSSAIPDIGMDRLGMSSHYQSVGQGVIDSRDIIYFLGVVLVFILATTLSIKGALFRKKSIKPVVITIAGLVLVHLLSQAVFKRIDLTEDGRYTLNASTIDLVEGIESPIIVDIFLDGDEFPSEFKRLKRETRLMLEEFASINSSVKFGFIDPLEDPDSREQNIRQLSARGLTPMELSVQESGRSSKAVIFPWALASYEGVTVKIPLVKNKLGSNQEELVNNSVQNLEYAFADGFGKLLFPKRRKIAVLKGNGELPNRNIADFITTLRDYYFIAPFTLDAVEKVPQKTLDSLLNFDLIIAAKPTERFSEKEKYILDQYTLSGGKSLWLIDAIAMDKDSLLRDGSGIATPRDLNLTDFFFKYGIRINPKLVSDLYSAPITLASGEGSQARFSQLPWFYSPLINPTDTHPITKNINLVRFDFPSPIDTLKNDLSQTILLESSVLSRSDGVPKEITIETATKEPDPEDYSSGPFVLSVLIEGEFTSVYKNRVKPLDLRENLDDGADSKMIVVADGDMIRNEVSNNRPLELGFDRWTGQLYGNKEFLLNAVNYLLDDSGLINIRSKNMSIAFLDQQKVAESGGLWKILNLLIPLLALGLFGMLFHYFRRKKYAL